MMELPTEVAEEEVWIRRRVQSLAECIIANMEQSLTLEQHNRLEDVSGELHKWVCNLRSKKYYDEQNNPPPEER